MKKTRTYGFGMRIGRMTNDANQANLLAQASTELAKAGSMYRRADDEQSTPHKREARESGLAQATLGMRFLLEFVIEAGESIDDIVANFRKYRDDYEPTETPD